ncbi:hypothetical protein BT69DRAFT_1343975 [Atractiella rhizophila]|nr:hypothetical protein BT69DRAFT_1343975 [Atractiella rhizophila]
MSRPASPTHVRHSPLPSAQVSPPLRSALKSPRTSWSYPSSTAPKVSISNNSTAIDSESSSLIDTAPSESRLTEEDHTSDVSTSLALLCL